MESTKINVIHTMADGKFINISPIIPNKIPLYVITMTHLEKVDKHYKKMQVYEGTSDCLNSIWHGFCNNLVSLKNRSKNIHRREFLVKKIHFAAELVYLISLVDFNWVIHLRWLSGYCFMILFCLRGHINL